MFIPMPCKLGIGMKINVINSASLAIENFGAEYSTKERSLRKEVFKMQCSSMFILIVINVYY